MSTNDKPKSKRPLILVVVSVAIVVTAVVAVFAIKGKFLPSRTIATLRARLPSCHRTRQVLCCISVGLVFAFIMLTVAELFGASNCLGRFVQLYADYADYPRMVSGILYTRGDALAFHGIAGAHQKTRSVLDEVMEVVMSKNESDLFKKLSDAVVGMEEDSARQLATKAVEHDIPPRRFVETAVSENADLIALSTLMTTR